VGYPDLALKPLFLRYPIRRVNRRLHLVALLISASLPMMAQNNQTSPCSTPSSEVVAVHIPRDIPLDASHPAPEWEHANPVSFCADWKGEHPDPERQTTASVLWSNTTLFLRFECRYRALNVFQDSDPNGRRDHLWDKDVAEVFLQPDPSRERYYKEFEVSPNGMWIDLDISPGPLQDLKSGMQRSVFLDEKSRIWTAELAIPLRSLTPKFDANAVWRANFYRVEGAAEPRNYFAWQPTRTPEPNFHVPSAFGRLKFHR
jgi:alpha-galactosidase